MTEFVVLIVDLVHKLHSQLVQISHKKDFREFLHVVVAGVVGVVEEVCRHK